MPTPVKIHEKALPSVFSLSLDQKQINPFPLSLEVNPRHTATAGREDV
jgi:hypothetical protein